MMKSASSAERASIVQFAFSLFPALAFGASTISRSEVAWSVIFLAGVAGWLLSMTLAVILIAFEAWKKTGPYFKSYRWFLASFAFGSLQMVLIVPRL